MLETKAITKKDKNFNKYVEILIKKYESLVTQSRGDAIIFFGWFLSLIIAFLTVYITYQLPAFSIFFPYFLSANLVIKLILFSICFTMIYLGSRLMTLITTRTPLKNILDNIFGISDIDSNIKILTQLYLVQLYPGKNWELKIEIDEDKGVLKLIGVIKKTVT